MASPSCTRTTTCMTYRGAKPHRRHWICSDPSVEKRAANMSMTYTNPRRHGAAETIVEVANLSAARSVNIDNILTCTHDRTRVRVDAAPSLLCMLIGSPPTNTISLTQTCFLSLVPGKHPMGLPPARGPNQLQLQRERVATIDVGKWVVACRWWQRNNA